jgi:Flp pilus assembly protein CpaB
VRHASLTLVALLALVGVALGSFSLGNRHQEEASIIEVQTVIVSRVDIPAGARLDRYVNEGQFTQLSVPFDALVAGAVIDIRQLKGRRSQTPILANEQIPLVRITRSLCPPPGPCN